jgi:hypothetical protein
MEGFFGVRVPKPTAELAQWSVLAAEPTTTADVVAALALTDAMPTSSTKLVCLKCPAEGLDCEDEATTLGDVAIMQNFWLDMQWYGGLSMRLALEIAQARPTTAVAEQAMVDAWRTGVEGDIQWEALRLDYCRVYGACAEGRNIGNWTQCENGASGRVCSECADGWVKSLEANGVCQECPEEQTYSELICAGIALLIFCVLFYLVRANYKAKYITPRAVLVRIFINYAQFNSTLGSMKASGPSTFRSTLDVPLSFGNPSAVANIKYVSCAIDWNYMKRFWFYALLPIVMIVVPLMGLTVHYQYRKATVKKMRVREELWGDFQAMLGTSVALCLFMVHSNVSSAMLNTLKYCTEIAGELYITDDLGEHCDNRPWWKALAFSAAWVVGIPLGAGVLLVRRREMLSEYREKQMAKLHDVHGGEVGRVSSEEKKRLAKLREEVVEEEQQILASGPQADEETAVEFLTDADVRRSLSEDVSAFDRQVASDFEGTMSLEQQAQEEAALDNMLERESKRGARLGLEERLKGGGNNGALQGVAPPGVNGLLTTESGDGSRAGEGQGLAKAANLLAKSRWGKAFSKVKAMTPLMGMEPSVERRDWMRFLYGGYQLPMKDDFHEEHLEKVKKELKERSVSNVGAEHSNLAHIVHEFKVFIMHYKYCWELTVIFEKMSAIFISIMIKDDFMQAYAALLLIFCSLQMHMFVVPFDNYDVDFLRWGTLMATFFTQAFCLLYWHQGADSELPITGILVFMHGSVAIVFIFCFKHYAGAELASMLSDEKSAAAQMYRAEQLAMRNMIRAEKMMERFGGKAAMGGMKAGMAGLRLGMKGTMMSMNAGLKAGQMGLKGSMMTMNAGLKAGQAGLKVTKMGAGGLNRMASMGGNMTVGLAKSSAGLTGKAFKGTAGGLNRMASMGGNMTMGLAKGSVSGLGRLGKGTMSIGGKLARSSTKVMPLSNNWVDEEAERAIREDEDGDEEMSGYL